MKVQEHSTHRVQDKGPVYPQCEWKLNPWWNEHYPTLKDPPWDKHFLSSTVLLGHGGKASRGSKGLLVLLADTSCTSARDINTGTGNQEKGSTCPISLERQFWDLTYHLYRNKLVLRTGNFRCLLNGRHIFASRVWAYCCPGKWIDVWPQWGTWVLSLHTQGIKYLSVQFLLCRVQKCRPR